MTDLTPTGAVVLPSYNGAISESFGCAIGNACLADKNSPVGTWLCQPEDDDTLYLFQNTRIEHVAEREECLPLDC